MLFCNLPQKVQVARFIEIKSLVIVQAKAQQLRDFHRRIRNRARLFPRRSRGPGREGRCGGGSPESQSRAFQRQDVQVSEGCRDQTQPGMGSAKNGGNWDLAGCESVTMSDNTYKRYVAVVVHQTPTPKNFVLLRSSGVCGIRRDKFPCCCQKQVMAHS